MANISQCSRNVRSDLGLVTVHDFHHFLHHIHGPALATTDLSKPPDAMQPRVHIPLRVVSDLPQGQLPFLTPLNQFKLGSLPDTSIRRFEKGTELFDGAVLESGFHDG